MNEEDAIRIILSHADRIKKRTTDRTEIRKSLTKLETEILGMIIGEGKPSKTESQEVSS